jgi:hypothetical protein
MAFSESSKRSLHVVFRLWFTTLRPFVRLAEWRAIFEKYQRVRERVLRARGKIRHVRIAVRVLKPTMIR